MNEIMGRETEQVASQRFNELAKACRAVLHVARCGSQFVETTREFDRLKQIDLSPIPR